MESREETVSVAGSAGLALLIGELRAEQRHDREENAREIAEVRSDLAECFQELATVRDENQALRDEIRVVTELLDTVVNKFDSTTGGTRSQNTAADTQLTPPTRERGESNTAHYKKLASWAEKNGVTLPPKVKSGPMAPSAATYDKQISAWKQQIAD